jgi:hypothetical protein
MYLYVRQICKAGVAKDSLSPILLHDFVRATNDAHYLGNIRANGWGTGNYSKYNSFQLMLS